MNREENQGLTPYPVMKPLLTRLYHPNSTMSNKTTGLQDQFSTWLGTIRNTVC